MNEQNRSNLYGPCAHIFDAANTGSWRLERPKVDGGGCVRCGVCGRNCPADVISLDKAGVGIGILWEYCKGCGICANECPKKCITMVPEEGGQ
jgi:2-oxoacid:acceptor oxidoreductase delta subunit (pyruvate/2-ketoisovalerate family)